MATEEIIEGNRLIDFFMGAAIIPLKDEYNYEVIRWNPSGFTKTQSYFAVSHKENYRDKFFNQNVFISKYDSDWNWLMPVVEKIEKIKISTSTIGVSVEIRDKACRIFKGEWCESIEGFTSFVSYSGNTKQYTKIEVTWLAVVEFIKWYNKQNKKS